MENRDKAEEMDDIIKRNIIIDKANFEYCAKNEIINGSLLAGIRQSMLDFHAQQVEAEMPSNEACISEALKRFTCNTGYLRSEQYDGFMRACRWLRSRLSNKC